MFARGTEVRGELLRLVAGVGQEVEIGILELAMDEADGGDFRRGGEVGLQILAERSAELALVLNEMCAGQLALKEPLRNFLNAVGFGVAVEISREPWRA